MPKLPSCCARKRSQVTFQQGELLSFARRAAKRPGNVALQSELTKSQDRLATAKENYAEHIHDDTLEHG